MANIGSMEDIQSLFKETIAEFMENGLEAELDDELGYSKYDYKNKDTDNSRNGYSSKTLRASFGDVEVSVPRDRKGEFESKVLKKNQTSISRDIEEKILSMYAKGMTTSDIEAHIQDIYGVEVSDTTVSRITDKILPIAKEWQQRPLEAIYAVVFLDAIHYHVRSEGQIVKKAVYIAIGINLDVKKDVLGMWVGENESAKFWATVLNSLKKRGVEDIFIACTDNLTGFSAAIEAVFPKTEVQNCIMRLLTMSIRELLESTNEDSKDFSRHAMSRIVYGACLASNTLDYLMGKDVTPKYHTDVDHYQDGTKKIIEYWTTRWLSGRLNYAPVFERIHGFDKESFLVRSQINDGEEWSFKKLKEVSHMPVNDCLYTNGFTEGCNNRIKVIKRVSFGIRNFDYFRNRILHCVSLT